ncbi:hypothetical protein [Bacillus cereus]|uniref:hypothetical protein n=1 Tax=Bacillus cereus TaxID=1396 RepID=UPI001E494EDF|nr:hypothetical protein [Bacillus cereus]
MLFKFFRPEHVQMFLDGNLYFKNTGYFIDLESELGDKGIGDKHEGAFFRAFNPETDEMYIMLENGEKIKMNFKHGYAAERYEVSRQFQLTCFTGMFIDEDMEEVGENQLKIKQEVINELKKEFPDRVPILILNEEELFNRIDTIFSEKEIRALHGYVTYFDEHKEPPLKEEDYRKDITQAFFYKRNFFKSQKEYRIITSHPVEGDSLEAKLNSIDDIVFNVGDMDNLAKLTFMKIEQGVRVYIEN